MRNHHRLRCVVALAISGEVVCLVGWLGCVALGGPAVFCRAFAAVLYPAIIAAAAARYGGWPAAAVIAVLLFVAFAEIFLPIWLGSELVSARRRRRARKMRPVASQAKGTS